METVYWLIIFYSAIFFAYTHRFQQATLYWGKKIAPDNEFLPTGLQDAITPKTQTRRNLVCAVLLILSAVAGFIILGWYMAIIGPIVVFFGSSFISVLMRWQPNSSVFKFSILKDLDRRLNDAKKSGNTAQTIALEEVIRRMNSTDDVG